MYRLLSLLLTAAFGATGCTIHQGRPDGPAPLRIDSSYQIRRDQVFTPPGWPAALLADVYVPEGEGPFPAVLVIHGGGWESGDRAQVKGLAERIARRGYVAVNTTYRLAPGAIFPAQLQDVQQAVLWMRAQAATYRIDPTRIGAFGYSAGAHLAALLGGIGEAGPLGQPGAAIKAVVAGGTPTDLSKWPAGKLVPQFIGGNRSQKPAEYRAASPVSYVNAGDPPVFLYHGGADALVPIDHAEDYQKLLAAADVPNELFVLRGRGHILAFLTDGPAVDAALTFLDRHLR
ncbi:Acetyl esterase/lipase [Hydrocarboniphaga daqingensis]|uniref:Acetyl esterase/lipase n=1 Tax=Hydrocarboniphaga daqingensis TaxID=490188 RepID=A0A1M5N9E7_9GAMM|nr:alpha/beta hydrolase [Hydrocarboniphaga daqingensis]SHG86131.1 Acetyl esterase/lipase [Hydrocarboniphaga daqingensis]